MHLGIMMVPNKELMEIANALMPTTEYTQNDSDTQKSDEERADCMAPGCI
jgi:hypothetical protein